jgi:hypothetical protein
MKRSNRSKRNNSGMLKNMKLNQRKGQKQGYAPEAHNVIQRKIGKKK